MTIIIFILLSVVTILIAIREGRTIAQGYKKHIERNRLIDEFLSREYEIKLLKHYVFGSHQRMHKEAEEKIRILELKTGDIEKKLWKKQEKEKKSEEGSTKDK